MRLKCSINSFIDNKMFLSKPFFLPYQNDGFYVECCTTDGEKDSTSLFFERVRKWNGLVISPEPEKFTALQMKHRKAAIMNSCLSDSEHPVKVFLL